MASEKKRTVNVVCKHCREKFEATTFDSVNERLCPACIPLVKDLTTEIRDYVRAHPGISVEVVCNHFKVNRKMIMEMLRNEMLQVHQ